MFWTEQMVQLARGQPDTDGTPFGTYSAHQTLGDYGLRLAFGMQWTPLPRLDLGMSIQSATLTGFRDVLNTNFSSFQRVSAPSEFQLTEQDGLKSVWDPGSPSLTKVSLTAHEMAFNLGGGVSF